MISYSFTLIQGFHQRCPLLMNLRIIVAEILTIFVDADTRIKGMQIRGHEIKMVIFADDATICLRDFSCLTKIEFFYLKKKLFK